MKASKRLLVAVVALFASIILCLGAVLAWFAVNSEVTAKDLDSSIRDDDIISFEVIAHYLDESDLIDGSYETTDKANVYDYLGTPPTVDMNGDGVLDERDFMRPQSTSSTTAILFEIKYTIRCNNKYYRIYAACEDTNDHPEVVNKGSDTYSSKLSNSVYVSTADVENNGGVSTFKEAGAKKSFVIQKNNSYDKTKKIIYARDVIPRENVDGAVYDKDGNYTGTKYLIMDYESELFSYLLSRVLVAGGNLTSELLFEGDVNIGIEPYDPTDLNDESNLPDSIQLMTEGSPLLRQEVSTVDVMLSSWKFIVTNKDGSSMTVTPSNSSVTVSTVDAGGNLIKADGLITDAVGSYIARVTHAVTPTDSVYVDVPYEITANVDIEKVELSPATLTLRYGESARITASVLPANSYTGEIQWTSSNPDAVSVSNGVVTAKSKTATTVTITATASEVSGGVTIEKSATCTVNVAEALVPQTITMTGGSTNLMEGESPAGTWLFTVTYAQKENGVNITKTNMRLGEFTRQPEINTSITGNSASQAKTVTLSYAENGSDPVTLEVPYTVYAATSIQLASGSSTEIYKGTVNPDWSFVVKYDSGSVHLSKTVKLSDASITLSGFDPEKDGTATAIYTFNGKSVNCSVPYTVTEAPTQHTVTFVSEGATLGTTQILTGKSVPMPSTDPKRDGYKFLGWYTQADGGAAYDFSTPVTEDFTLYAHWTKLWTVTFNSQGGSSVNSQTVEDGKTASARTTTRSGYSFSGWYTAAEGGSVYDFSTPVTGNITLYAHWTQITYTVTFDADGGTISGNSTATVPENGTVTPPAVSRSGYTLDGWYTPDNVKFTNTYTVTSNLTVTARWTINKYTVAFDTQGGSTVSSQTVEHNKKATKPASDPTRTGYTFNGWFTAASGGSAFNFNTAITANTTVYAQWTVNSYTVTFDTQGGSTVASQTIEYNKKATKPADPAREGYTFKGWFTAASGGSAFNFNTAITAETTVYAQWTQNGGAATNIVDNMTVKEVTTNGAEIYGDDNVSINAQSKGKIYAFTNIIEGYSKAIKPSSNRQSLTIKAKKAITITITFTVTDSGGTNLKAGTITVSGVTDANSPYTIEQGATQTVTYALQANDTVTLTPASNSVSVIGIQIS